MIHCGFSKSRAVYGRRRGVRYRQNDSVYELLEELSEGVDRTFNITLSSTSQPE